MSGSENLPQARLAGEDQLSGKITLTAGLMAGSPILTADGLLPVQFLSPGDRIITRSGTCILRAVEVKLLRDAPMIRVSASSLGHDRPEEDIFLAPDQEILLRDWRAKALYGQDQAAVPVRRLVDGCYIRVETLSETRLFTLRFARDEVIYSPGLELVMRAES